MASRCRRACRYRHPILLQIMEILETFSLPLVLGLVQVLVLDA